MGFSAREVDSGSPNQRPPNYGGQVTINFQTFIFLEKSKFSDLTADSRDKIGNLCVIRQIELIFDPTLSIMGKIF